MMPRTLPRRVRRAAARAWRPRCSGAVAVGAACAARSWWHCHPRETPRLVIPWALAAVPYAVVRP
jgi:hypothetical protein